MNRLGQVKTTDEDASKREWREDVKIFEKFKQYRWRFVQNDRGVSEQVIGHLGRVTGAKNSIKLEPSNKCPVHSAWYREGHETRILEKEEV